MPYFFDLHCNGEVFLDDKGCEFPSADEARQYVVACGRILPKAHPSSAQSCSNASSKSPTAMP